MYNQNPWGNIDNPYAQGAYQSQDAMLNQMPGLQQNIQGMQSQYNQLYGQQNSYPAYPNAFGLGGPIGGAQPIPGAAANPDYLAKPLTVGMPDSGSRGFNPWSLTGESNARGQ